MIRQKRQNCREPPVDTACGNVEFCNALPEGSGFVLLRRDKVYLSIRLRIKLRRTSRGAGLRQGSRLPAMCHRPLSSHKISDNENITYLAKKVKSCCKNCSWVYIIRVYIDIKAT